MKKPKKHMRIRDDKKNKTTVTIRKTKKKYVIYIYVYISTKNKIIMELSLSRMQRTGFRLIDANVVFFVSVSLKLLHLKRAAYVCVCVCGIKGKGCFTSFIIISCAAYLNMHTIYLHLCLHIRIHIDNNNANNNK